MKQISILSIVTILLFPLFLLNHSTDIVKAQDGISPTPSPTYDPLAEPVLPENPTELELGQFWYWHNCMTCHGDVGQGLTDDFRGIWPEDHQNCWAHGCHNGNVDGGGFPIPTYVPPLVTSDKLAKFSQQGLFAFLKSTHPPQTPGVLEDQQYLAIIKFVFSMNERPVEEVTPEPTLEPTPEPTLPPTPTPYPVTDQIPASPASETSQIPIGAISIGVFLLIILIWRFQSRKP